MRSERSAFGAGLRLHPLSVLFGLGRAAKGLLLPGLLVLFASRGSSYEIWAMVLFLPAAVAALVRYWTYRYRFEPEELVIREGILTRTERHIPYDRIQNIDLVQNPLHRLLRVALVRVETASGSRPEAEIRVLSLRAVREMRARVFEKRRDDGGAPAEDAAREPADAGGRPLHRLGLGDLVLFGVISNRGMAVVAAAVGVAWQLGLFENQEQKFRALAGRRSFLRHVTLDPLAAGGVALAALVVLLLLLRLLSVSWAVAKFHGFRLRLHGDDLRAEYGLLPHVSATVPRHRIQLLSTRQTMLHRWFGRSSVRIETAGGSPGEDDGAGAEKLWLAPVIHSRDVVALVACVLPEIDLDALDWQPLAPGARARLLKECIVVLLLVTAGAVALVRPWGLLLLPPGLLLCLLHARNWVRHTAWAVTPHAVVYRSGWWVRRLSVVRLSKIQVLTLAESPFDRRRGMASVRVDTAGAGRVGHRVDVDYLGLATARDLVGRLYDEASRTSYRW
jgi:putative membrane protein